MNGFLGVSQTFPHLPSVPERERVSIKSVVELPFQFHHRLQGGILYIESLQS